MNKTPGQIAYEAYCATTGWKSLVTGADLPQWDAQKPAIAAAWEAAAGAVLGAGFPELEKGQRFKAYVHKRLDDAGVPIDPPSPHQAEGCRIGGRLDWLLARVKS